jgi:hypothetical protein
MDIQINPREVVIMTANGGAREIYTDGRLHPADPLPSTKGHSIGRWEGQTLVIDTCCVRSDTRLPGGGSHSDVMHITERISSPDGHTLKDAITVEDPKAFTKPWTTEKTYYRRPDWEQVEYDRDENTRDFGKAPPAGERPTNSSSPPAAASVVSPAANGATPAYAATAPSGPPADSEALQKATAIGAGNLAWETVIVSDIRRDATTVKWLATTKSTKWHCTAAPDGTKPYCER